MEEVCLFIDNAVGEINDNIVMATCAYKYVFLDTIWGEI
jgi:hypothetical protein